MSVHDPLPDYCLLEARLYDAMRPGLRETEFNELAMEVHAFQCRWNGPYAAFATRRPQPTRWQEIPAVPQSAFKNAALSCVPREQITHTFRTSGTTGERRGEHHFYNTGLYDASIVGGWRELRLPRLRQIILAPHPDEAPHSSLSHMFATLATESAGEQAWCCDDDGRLDLPWIRSALRRAEEGDSLILLGTALAFLNLFESLQPDEHQLRGSIALETGGYKGSGRDISKPELYSRFQRHLGIPAENVINEYGMTELSSQFYTRGLGGVHRGPAWVKALVIDPETGEEVAIGRAGVLRIFDLANLNSSLAIETQDLAIRLEGGVELLGRDPHALPRGCSRAADEVMHW
jgi:hypothetical protein